jgi:hypothetical protein
VIKMQQTSLDTWDEWRGKPSAQLDGEILRTLWAAGPTGMMCWQIEMVVGRTHQAVSGNMTHLARDGGIVRTDRKGKTPRGYTAYYWVHANHAGPQDRSSRRAQDQPGLFD